MGLGDVELRQPFCRDGIQRAQLTGTEPGRTNHTRRGGMARLRGTAVARRLGAAGATVVGVSRSKPRLAGYLRTRPARHRRARDPAAWRPHLPASTPWSIAPASCRTGRAAPSQARSRHGPAALFEACARAGVRRVVHLSAQGADHGASGFSSSKRAGDEALKASDLQWVILRPSIVIGANAFGGAALLRGWRPCPSCRCRATTPSCVQSTSTTWSRPCVLFLQPNAPTRVTLELVGPAGLPVRRACRRCFGAGCANVRPGGPAARLARHLVVPSSATCMETSDGGPRFAAMPAASWLRRLPAIPPPGPRSPASSRATSSAR